MAYLHGSKISKSYLIINPENCQGCQIEAAWQRQIIKSKVSQSPLPCYGKSNDIDIPLPAIVAQVEALAARKAVEFALEISITFATFEGDLDIIFKELTSSGPSLALHGHLIEDVKF
ncbi:hypothetical protein SO802_004521 [Lithocarpus litseifolius]|uniref:Uncharacterized protein n=1 Tax=Lithocarpus litseifolius TaxID=425828 RepID=A0AAW2E362_9ROSI